MAEAFNNPPGSIGVSRISYAQNYEDVILSRIFAGKCGTYVDVGANNPDHNNITRRFYDAGWTGMNIEPVPELFSRFVEKRPRDVNINAACSDIETDRTLFVLDDTGLSTLEKELLPLSRSAALGQHADSHADVVERRISVRCYTLEQLLSAHSLGQIDFMIVDVEGHELQVLKGNNWSRFRPSLLVIEAIAPNSPEVRTDHAFTPYLESVGYRPRYFDGLNVFYTSSESSIPDGLFGPLNVFDMFIHWTHAEYIDALRAHIGHLDSVIEELTKRLTTRARSKRGIRS